MGLGKDIKQEARSLGEDLKDIKKGIISKAKAFKKAKENKESKSTSKKSSTLSKVGKSLRIDKKVKALRAKISRLKKKIDSGDATLEEKLEYKKLKGMLSQIPIQAGITAAQAGSLAVAPILYPVGSAVSAIAAAAGTKLAGSDESNKRLIQRYKEGKPLSPIERYRLKKAQNLGKKAESKKALGTIIAKGLKKKK